MSPSEYLLCVQSFQKSHEYKSNQANSKLSRSDWRCSIRNGNKLTIHCDQFCRKKEIYLNSLTKGESFTILKGPAGPKRFQSLVWLPFLRGKKWLVGSKVILSATGRSKLAKIKQLNVAIQTKAGFL